MSDKPADPKPASTAAPAAEGAAAAAAPAKAARSKGYTNPALQAMGIPRLRIPSRNWMIFWTLLGGFTGMYAYDRYERRKRRQTWKDRVSHFAKVPMGAMELPRKVTVYIAPPPSDYMDVSMSHFKQYVKPILVSAAVDYEVKGESRQGEIRHMVAEEIRNKRRVAQGLPPSESDPETKKDALDKQIEQNLDRDQTGGIIIIGRGAYKEFLNGVQEGWLGPLENPHVPEPEVVENPPDVVTERPVETLGDVPAQASESTLDSTLQTSALTPDSSLQTSESVGSELSQEPEPVSSATQEEPVKDPSAFPDREEDEAQIMGQTTKEEDEKKPKKAPVPKPYITEMSANSGRNGGPKVWAAEIPTPNDLAVATPEEVSAPLGIIGHRHILGFLNTPIRIYRFFNRRELAEELGSATAAVVFAATRPYDAATDPQALEVEEKEDWAKRWKQKSLDNGSEWMWDFGVDDRISEKLRVYTLDDETRAKFTDLTKPKE